MPELNLPACPICQSRDSLIRRKKTIEDQTYTWYECRDCRSALLWMGGDLWAYQKILLPDRAYLLKQPLTAGELREFSLSTRLVPEVPLIEPLIWDRPSWSAADEVERPPRLRIVDRWLKAPKEREKRMPDFSIVEIALALLCLFFVVAVNIARFSPTDSAMAPVVARTIEPPVVATATSPPTDTPQPTRTPEPTRRSEMVNTPEPTATPVPPVKTPKPGTVRTRSKDGMEMVYVPAGRFLMGTSGEDVDAILAECSDCEREWFSAEQPQHTVHVDAFWMDKTEVTNARYRLCVGAGVCGRAEFWNDTVLNAPHLPVVGVSWKDAQTYCRWVEARLPTEAEWEKAARGTEGWIYPWGDSFDGTRLNFCDRSCEFWWEGIDADDGYDKLAPVGSYPAGASPYGALDMAGNVWEWVADWHDGGYYSHSPHRNPLGPSSGERRVVRGGCWSMDWLLAGSSVREGVEPDTQTDEIGFRCCMPDGAFAPEATPVPERAEAQIAVRGNDPMGHSWAVPSGRVAP